MAKCVFIDYLVRRLRQLSKGMYKKVTYVRICKFMIQKEKSLFIPIKLHSITISSVIPYISEINSTSSSLKKKRGMERGCAKEREKKRGKRKKERKSVKGKRKKMGRRRKRRKRGRENEREGEGEERRERERRGENRKGGTKNVPPSPKAFPSTKLGKNITPIKGRLGKNTTPTGGGSLELNQNPKADPLR